MKTLIFSGLLALSGSVQAQDYFINRHVADSPNEQNITLDGNYFDDSFWNAGVTKIESNGNVVIAPTDNRLAFAATYDDTYLYLGVHASDPMFSLSQSWFHDDSPSNTPWEDDAIEVFIDPKNGLPLFQAIVSHKADNNVPPELWINSNYNASGILFETAFGTMKGSGYSMEMAIPWSKFGITPRGGLALGLDIAIDDDDNGGARDGQITWKGTINNFNSTANYGQVKLRAAMYGVPYITYYNGAPIIDGEVINDVAYINSPVAGISKKVIGNSDNEVNVRLTRDGSYLYVGLVVWDNHAYTNTLYNDSPEGWNDDAIEIFIDPYNTKLPYFNPALHRQIIVQFSSAAVPPEVSVRGSATGILAASGLINTPIYVEGYSVEVAIPWSNLGISPISGQYMGFDISIDDDDNGGNRDSQLAWKGTIDNWQNPSVWGNIQFMYTGYSIDPATTRKIDEALALEAKHVETTCYPNPVKDELTIQLNPIASSVKVTDVYGKELASANVEGTSHYFLNTSSFESGLYLITVIDVYGKVETFKITR